MEQTFVHTTIRPDDKLRNDKHKLLECKGQVINSANHSNKKNRKFECKELIIDIIDTDRSALDALEASRCPDNYCIYRVPKRLRKVNNMAYTPRLVSIGPFHHRSEVLKDMDIQKLLILKNFCNRAGKSIENLKDIIRPEEEKIRSCYSETILISSEGFLNMILLDAIFILELFCKKSEKDSRRKAHMLYQKFYQNKKPDRNQKPTLPTLFQLSCRFFGDLDKYHGRKPESWFKDLEVRLHRPQNPRPSSLEPKNDEVKSVKHFTDLVRYFFCPTKTEKTKLEPNCCIENVRNNTHLHGTATKLDEAGLKLTKPKPKPDSERELLQIQFPENKCLESCPWLNLSWLLSCLPFLKSIDCLERRVRPRLEVPPLLLDDKIEGLFRNLMALEQCHYPSETYICDYIVLLDDLITTKEDVRLLVEKKIIVNELGSSAAVTKLVNNLALEIEESGNCDYKKLCEKVNDYYKSSWNRLVGILTRTYFSDFFKGTATVVGIIILVLTLWNFQRLVRLSARKYYI
ncbi:hypothetical protein CIPAW_14G022800 [Carya illinoinensis]|uniref:Uncharacterized protein n=1 Tax=Carya illinoinensis TaxID=32201 RepID=A0A8T1NA16_CARIL|nr:hypothetical protein CIPAW_14G022800 [Carya illinoinensis]